MTTENTSHWVKNPSTIHLTQGVDINVYGIWRNPETGAILIHYPTHETNYVERFSTKEALQHRLDTLKTIFNEENPDKLIKRTGNNTQFTGTYDDCKQHISKQITP